MIYLRDGDRHGSIVSEIAIPIGYQIVKIGDRHVGIWQATPSHLLDPIQLDVIKAEADQAIAAFEQHLHAEVLSRAILRKGEDDRP